MLKNFLRKLLKPIIQQCMNENEWSISNRYIADMRSIHRDLNDIRIALKGIEDRELAALCIKKADDISNDMHEEIDVLFNPEGISGTDAFELAIKNGMVYDGEMKKRFCDMMHCVCAREVRRRAYLSKLPTFSHCHPLYHTYTPQS